MAPGTRLKTNSIGQADGQLFIFDELADFANLGAKPDDWKGFRSKYQDAKYKDFFPSSLTEWLYKDAEKWAKFCSDHPVAARSSPTVPPLLLYRDLLRTIWRTDPPRAVVSLLLGFSNQVERDRVRSVLKKAVRATFPSVEYIGRNFDPTDPLPAGRPVVDVADGGCTIRWEFGCQFQQGIYELMQKLWRAKVCLICKRFLSPRRRRRSTAPLPAGDKRRRSEPSSTTIVQENSAVGRNPTPIREMLLLLLLLEPDLRRKGISAGARLSEVIPKAI